MRSPEDYPTYPCVGCGYCCRKAQCSWSQNRHGTQEVCPELEQKENRYWCKAADNPELAREVAIGAGCCSPMNSDRGEAAVTLTQIMTDVNMV